MKNILESLRRIGIIDHIYHKKQSNSADLKTRFTWFDNDTIIIRCMATPNCLMFTEFGYVMNYLKQNDVPLDGIVIPPEFYNSLYTSELHTIGFISKSVPYSSDIETEFAEFTQTLLKIYSILYYQTRRD
jgi:hypothetical protein